MRIFLIVIMSGVAGFGILLTIRSIIDLKEFKSLFKCTHCGTVATDGIYHKYECKKCNRRFKDEYKVYDHYIIFRNTIVNTKHTGKKCDYKSNLKLFIAEVIVDFVGTSAVLAALLMEVLK